MGINERTLRMKQEYISLHEQGLTPGEIAEKFDLDVSTVYRSLGEIASSNGMERADLLARPHGEHVRYRSRLKKIEPFDISDFIDHIDKAISEAKELQLVMKKQVKRQEKVTRRIEEEENAWTVE